MSKKLSGIKIGTVSLVSGITYQPFGPVAAWTQGSGQGYARSFDQDGRLTGISIGGVTSETVALTYDSAGRITGINDALAAPKISHSGTTNFQYGSTSNRQTGSTGGMTKTYTYDATGNITGDGSVTFTYDARGRLTQATKGSVAQYAINGLGQRVAKTTTTAVPDEAPIVDSVLFVYDEAGHLLGEYGGTGAVIQETVWLEDLPVGVLTTGGQYYVNPDHLGAPLTVTDATGQIVWRWDRDPYGNGKPNENPSGLGAFTYNLRFPGQYYDKETELHYNYFRDYNPKTGRYVQADPIGLDGGVNLYGYVGGNPITFADETGLNTVVIVGSGTLVNPFGHVAIGFTGQGVYSYGTGTPTGSSFTDYIARQAQYRSSVLYILQTTPQQESQMKDEIMKYENITLPDPFQDPIGAWNDTCATRTQNALNAGGIRSTLFHFTSPFPMDLRAVGLLNPSSFIIIPKGGAIPGSLSVFNR